MTLRSDWHGLFKCVLTNRWQSSQRTGHIESSWFSDPHYRVYGYVVICTFRNWSKRCDNSKRTTPYHHSCRQPGCSWFLLAYVGIFIKRCCCRRLMFQKTGVHQTNLQRLLYCIRLPPYIFRSMVVSRISEYQK